MRSLPLSGPAAPLQSSPPAASPHPTKVPSRFESALPFVTKLLLPFPIHSPNVPSWLASQSASRLLDAPSNSIPALSFKSVSRFENVPLLPPGTQLGSLEAAASVHSKLVHGEAQGIELRALCLLQSELSSPP
jgi:hypothetical protein